MKMRRLWMIMRLMEKTLRYFRPNKKILVFRVT